MNHKNYLHHPDYKYKQWEIIINNNNNNINNSNIQVSRRTEYDFK